MAEEIIKLEDVNFWYDKGKPSEMQALKDINISIDQGEYVAFFGPSGSGKTTLLYLIAGVEQSQAGKIIIRGRDISKFSNQELAIYRQLGVGIVFQQFNLINNLTVLNNVALPMSFLGVSEKKRQEEAMKILKRLAIDHLSERFPGELSGGQQQRVGIARALANNAPIIIADEPLGNLDSENSKKVLEFLRELNEKDNRTIIMVTHEAWSLRDVHKVFYIKDGQVVKTEKTVNVNVAQSIAEELKKDLAPDVMDAERASSVLSSVLLPGFSDEEVIRFKSVVGQRLSGKIDSLDFFQFLDKSFKDGGVGLRSVTAHKTVNYVEEVMRRRQDIEKIWADLAINPEMPVNKDVINLRNWLLLEFHGNLDPSGIIVFDELLMNRLRNTINGSDFKRILLLSKKESGLGFAMHTAGRISEKLELAISLKKL